MAIVEDGFGPDQRVTVGTLGTIAHLAAARKVRSPAVVVIGDVVALSPHAPSSTSETAHPASDTTPPGPSSAVSRSADSDTSGGRIDPEHPPIVNSSADRGRVRSFPSRFPRFARIAPTAHADRKAASL